MFEVDDQSTPPQLPENLTGEQALSLLVGKESKYGSVEDLALATLHAQRHIAKLEQENADFRTKATQGKTVDDILAAIEARKSGAPGSEPPPPADPAQNPPKEPDIDALIAAALAKHQQASKADANVQAVEKALKELYLDQAGAVFKSAATTLGVDLEALSRQSPNAVISLVKSVTTPQNRPGNDPLPVGAKGTKGSGSVPSLATATRAQLKEMQSKGLINRDTRMRYETLNALSMGQDFFR